MTTDGRALETRTRVQSWIALGIVYVVWGSTYLAIRVGVAHLPPLLLAGIRYIVAGAVLYPIAARASAADRAHGGAGPDGAGSDRAGLARRGGRPGARAWLAGAVVGVLLLCGGNGGVSVAETTLPSGVAAVLVATVPLWMLVFAWPLEGRRVTAGAAAGLAIGLAGVAILAGAGLSGGRLSGVFIVIGASAAWGLGSVLSHRLPVPSHAMLAAAIEMLAGGAVLLAAAGACGEFSRARWSAVPATGWIALAYLIVPGSILAFTAYGYALAHLPVGTVATYAYVNPVVAVLAGIAFLGERFSWREGLGAALVLASVVIIMNRPGRPPAVVEEPAEVGNDVLAQSAKSGGTAQ